MALRCIEGELRSTVGSLSKEHIRHRDKLLTCWITVDMINDLMMDEDCRALALVMLHHVAIILISCQSTYCTVHTVHTVQVFLGPGAVENGLQKKMPTKKCKKTNILFYPHDVVRLKFELLCRVIVFGYVPVDTII